MRAPYASDIYESALTGFMSTLTGFIGWVKPSSDRTRLILAVTRRIDQVSWSPLFG